MRLLSFISTPLLLVHFGVLGDKEWPFPEKVPNWGDLRACLRDCICPCGATQCYCPIAQPLGCDSIVCVCLAGVRKKATDLIISCVTDQCNTTDEPHSAAKIFDNFCNEYYPSNISVGPSSSETGNTTSPLVTTASTETAHSTAQQGITLLWHTHTLITLMVSMVAIIGGLVAF